MPLIYAALYIYIYFVIKPVRLNPHNRDVTLMRLNGAKLHCKSQQKVQELFPISQHSELHWLEQAPLRTKISLAMWFHTTQVTLVWTRPYLEVSVYPSVTISPICSFSVCTKYCLFWRCCSCPSFWPEDVDEASGLAQSSPNTNISFLSSFWSRKVSFHRYWISRENIEMGWT